MGPKLPGWYHENETEKSARRLKKKENAPKLSWVRCPLISLRNSMQIFAELYMWFACVSWQVWWK
jgi:hypothetical protein